MKLINENSDARKIYNAVIKKIKNKEICDKISMYFDNELKYQSTGDNSINMLDENNNMFKLYVYPSIKNIKRINMDLCNDDTNHLETTEIKYIDNYIIVNKKASKIWDNSVITKRIKKVYENNNLIYIKEDSSNINTHIHESPIFTTIETHILVNNKPVIRYTKMQRNEKMVFTKTETSDREPFNTKHRNNINIYSSWPIEEKEYNEFTKSLKKY